MASECLLCDGPVQETEHAVEVVCNQKACGQHSYHEECVRSWIARTGGGKRAGDKSGPTRQEKHLELSGFYCPLSSLPPDHARHCRSGRLSKSTKRAAAKDLASLPHDDLGENRRCDWCGEMCDQTIQELNLLRCSSQCCTSNLYHQDCLEKHLRKMKLPLDRKIGFPCPRGHGPCSEFKGDECRGKIERSHPKMPASEKKTKAAKVSTAVRTADASTGSRKMQGKAARAAIAKHSAGRVREAPSALGHSPVVELDSKGNRVIPGMESEDEEEEEITPPVVTQQAPPPPADSLPSAAAVPTSYPPASHASPPIDAEGEWTEARSSVRTRSRHTMPWSSLCTCGDGCDCDECAAHVLDRLVSEKLLPRGELDFHMNVLRSLFEPPKIAGYEAVLALYWRMKKGGSKPAKVCAWVAAVHQRKKEQYTEAEIVCDTDWLHSLLGAALDSLNDDNLYPASISTVNEQMQSMDSAWTAQLVRQLGFLRFSDIICSTGAAECFESRGLWVRPVGPDWRIERLPPREETRLPEPNAADGSAPPSPPPAQGRPALTELPILNGSSAQPHAVQNSAFGEKAITQLERYNQILAATGADVLSSDDEEEEPAPPEDRNDNNQEPPYNGHSIGLPPGFGADAAAAHRFQSPPAPATPPAPEPAEPADLLALLGINTQESSSAQPPASGAGDAPGFSTDDLLAALVPPPAEKPAVGAGAVSTDAPVCTACRAPLFVGAVFCTYCGSPAEPASPPPPAPIPAGAAQDDTLDDLMGLLMGG